MTHHFLYWLGIGWWCLGLAHALLLCMSKTCLLLMRLLWSGGSSAHFTAYLWLFMAWVIFWFPICYGLLPLGARLCLIVGFSSFSLLFYSFHSLATISCRTTLPFLLWCLFDLSLLSLFGPAAYSSLNNSIWSLDSYSCYFGLFYYIAYGLLCPIYFFLGILGPFSNSAFPWGFVNFFGLHWPNYFILYP